MLKYIADSATRKNEKTGIDDPAFPSEYVRAINPLSKFLLDYWEDKV